MALKVLITDNVDPVCISLLEAEGIEADLQLKKTPEELKSLAAKADGWIIRSGTQITADLMDATSRLQVIGRAGVGVDNVDLTAATRRGILVINAPDGNTISTAEHSCAMLMALARRIPRANMSLAEGAWDRKSFKGSELYEKTLGVIGVGKIGRAVAARMQAFGMKILGFDPVMTRDAAERLGIELVSLDRLLAESDFITIHTPLNEATRGLLNAETLQQCKRGVCIVNCARGGIVEEQALLDALESGQVGGAALDVYSQEPPPPGLEELLRHPRVVATPHIAASTDEAQRKVAVQVTEQVIRALQGDPVQTPVNAMAIRMAGQREVQPYLDLAERLGQLAAQLTQESLRGVLLRCHGDVPERYMQVLSVAALKGLLGQWSSDPVNLISAPALAEEHGLTVDWQTSRAQGTYTNLIELVLRTETDDVRVAGTVFSAGDPRLVRIDGYELEVRLEGWLLLYRNEDRPGMIAAVGQILADAGINIGTLALGRNPAGAMAALTVDDELSPAVYARVASLPGVQDVHVVGFNKLSGV